MDIRIGLLRTGSWQLLQHVSKGARPSKTLLFLGWCMCTKRKEGPVWRELNHGLWLSKSSVSNDEATGPTMHHLNTNLLAGCLSVHLAHFSRP